MKKTGLFFNGDYHKHRPLTFKEIWNMKISEVFNIMNHMYPNCGCYLFNDSLAKNIDADWVTTNDINQFAEKYCSVVTTLYHHCGVMNIQSYEVDYLKRVLDTGINYVTLSLGFADSFQPDSEIGKKMIYQFSRMSERAEIGVRNEYTADILKKYGITNSRVIGCPSLFYHMNREFQMPSSTTEKVNTVNFNSYLFPVLLQRLTYQKPKLIQYMIEHYKRHYNDTCITLQQLPGKGAALTAGRIDEEIKGILIKAGRYYFNTDDWINGMNHVDFSFGSCLHGNIASVLSKTPALFVAEDERIKGVCDYHKLPYIDIRNFNDTLSIDNYFELADYSEFNKNYAKTYDNFVDFCHKNEVNLIVK